MRRTALVPQLVHDLIACLRCGGFVRGAYGDAHGRSVARLIHWDHRDLVAYYSRLAEELGARGLVRYLLKDSLACTLANKYRVRSRAKAYKKFGSTLGGFPMMSEDRPPRYRTEQPAPTWDCTRADGCPLLCASALGTFSREDPPLAQRRVRAVSPRRSRPPT